MCKLQINFYGILSDQYSLVLVQLLGKVVATDENSLVILPNNAEVDIVNDSLWRSASFWLPHCYIDNKLKHHNPIVLSTIEDYISNKYEIINDIKYLFLINPNNIDILTKIDNFKKVFIIFLSANDSILYMVRLLWKKLSHNQKYNLSFYKQNNLGKFELKKDNA